MGPVYVDIILTTLIKPFENPDKCIHPKRYAQRLSRLLALASLTMPRGGCGPGQHPSFRLRVEGEGFRKFRVYGRATKLLAYLESLGGGYGLGSGYWAYLSGCLVVSTIPCAGTPRMKAQCRTTLQEALGLGSGLWCFRVWALWVLALLGFRRSGVRVSVQSQK